MCAAPEVSHEHAIGIGMQHVQLRDEERGNRHHAFHENALQVSVEPRWTPLPQQRARVMSVHPLLEQQIVQRPIPAEDQRVGDMQCSCVVQPVQDELGSCIVARCQHNRLSLSRLPSQGDEVRICARVGSTRVRDLQSELIVLHESLAGVARHSDQSCCEWACNEEPGLIALILVCLSPCKSIEV